MSDIEWDDEPQPANGGIITWDDATPDPKASATVRSSLGTNPDKYAQVKQLATEAGLPFDTTERNIDDVAASQKLKQIQTLMLRNPVLARQLSDPSFAKVAHDDVPVLSKIGGTLAEPVKGLGGSFNDLNTSINMTLGALPTLYDKLHSLASGTDHTEASDYWFKKFVDSGVANKEVFAPDESTGFTGKALNQVGNLAGMFDQIAFTGGMGGEAQALVEPTVSKIMVNQTAHAFKSMAVPALSSGVETARSVVANGGTPEEAARAGVVSYMSNIAMGIGPLSMPGNLATRLGTGALYGDVLGDVNHDVMNMALPDNQQLPDLTNEDRALSALIGGIMGGVMGPRPHESFADVQKAYKAIEFNNNIQGLAETASLSKLRARDPQAFKQFVEQSSENGELQKVYINANTLHDALNQSGINPEEVKLNMPEVASQLDVARETNQDVAIPIADFATHIAGTDLQTAILGHLKVEPNGMTYDEGQKFYSEQETVMKEQAEKILNQKTANDEFVKSAQNVEDNLLSQIKATGRYSDDVAKSNATLLRDFYVTNAHRLGIKPEELFAMHPVRIGAEDLNGQTLHQSPNEERNLVALHNLSPENLTYADEIGGLPVPSIGITKADSAFDGFGGITLIGNHKMIDPKTGVPVFDADAYSSTYPRYIWDKVKSKVADSFLKKHQDVIEKSNERGLGFSQLYDALVNHPDRDEAIRIFENSRFGMRAFLKSKGIDLDVPIRDVQLDSGRYINDEKVLKAWDKVGDKLHDMSHDTLIASPEYKELSDVVDDALKRMSKGDDHIYELYKNNVINNKGLLNYSSFDKIGRDVKNIGKTEPDTWTDSKNLRDEVSKYGNEMRDFAKSEIEPLFDAPKIEVKGRKVPVNLDNIVQAMTSKTVNGKEKSMTYGTGKANASMAKRFKSLDEIKADRDRVVSSEAHEAHKKDAEKIVDDYRNTVLESYSIKNWRGEVDTWSGLDDATKALGEIGKIKNSTDDQIISILKRNYFDIPDDKKAEVIAASKNAVKSLRDTPVDYFEAKPQRAVGLNEFHGAVIPHDISQSVKDVLDRNGVKTFEYQSGDKESRRAAIEQASKSLDEELGGVLFQGERGAFDPKTNTIALLKAADLSTFHHEAGHFFLETLDRLADTSPEIADDFNKTLDWFGIKATPEMSAIDQWRNMSLEEKREYHEKFARGFEAYLFEGKSPSLEMASTFQRFKSWMMRVYKSIEELGVKLDPEIRGVYDRLLATDEQIKNAEQSRSMLPMFSDAEKAGMTPEEFSLYHALNSAATDSASSELQARSLRDMKWIGNKHDKAFKEVTKDVETKRTAERIEARKQVMTQPVYQAWQFLTGRIDRLVRQKLNNAGIDPSQDNMLTAIAKLGGLSKDAVVSEWGTETKDVREHDKVFGKPILRVNGGDSVDTMGEKLAELGYLPVDINGKYSMHDFEEAFAKSVRGEEVRSLHADDFALESKYGMDDKPVISQDQYYGRLNSEIVKARYGEEVFNKLNKLHMLRSDGMHPDDVAEHFGIKSGDDLIKALDTSPTPHEAIETQTDNNLLEKYGDITSPKAMSEAADAAVHNDVRARVLATELKALLKSTGNISDITRAAKEAARKVIGSKVIKDLDTRIFTSAEARAGRESLKALAKGETERAATEKRNQILNNQFAKAAIEAKAEIDKTLKYFKKFDKATTAKSVGADYMDRINELLSQHDLTKRDISQAKLDQRQDLRDWLQSEFERTGIMPEIDENLLDFANRKSYMEMTVDELRSLHDAIKSLEHVGREQQHIMINGQKVELAEMVQRALDGTKDLEHKEPVDIQPHLLHARGLDKLNAKWLSLKSKIRSADAALIKMEQLFQWLSAGKRAGLGDNVQGPYLEIFKRAADAEGKERQLRADAVARIKALHMALGDAKVDLNESLQLPLFRKGRNNQWYREELLAVALNLGNKGNREKLAAGYGWDINQVDALLDKHLSTAEWKFVQGVWDAVGVYGKEIEDLQRRQTGISPKMVEPMPFKNSHGSFEGGYYPVVYDTFQDHNVELKEAKNADTLFENQWARPTTSKGHTINRTNYVGPIQLSLGVIGKHIDQVTHDLAWREAIIDMNKFLSHKDIHKDVDEVMGREYTKQFRPWLQALANDKVFNTSGDAGWENIYRGLRTNATIVGLGFRLTTMEIHGLTAMSNSIGEVGVKWFAKGAAQFATPERWRESVKFIFERSPEMANRMNESDRNIHEAIDNINHNQNSLLGVSYTQKLVDGARKFSMYGVGALDMGSAMPTWMGAYLKGIDKQGLNMTEQEAIDFANRAVRNAHGGGGTKDLAAIQRDKGAMSLFTMFYSFWNHMYNRQRDLAKGYSNIGEAVKGGNGTADVSKLLARSFFYFVVPQIIHAALKPSQQDKHDENTGDLSSHLKHLAEEVGLGFVSGVPGVRDLANSLVNGMDYTITPLEQAGKTIVSSTRDTYHYLTGANTSKHAVKNVVNSVGYVAGLPTGQASSSVEFLADVYNGTQDPQNIADWWAGIHTGDMNKK